MKFDTPPATGLEALAEMAATWAAQNPAIAIPVGAFVLGQILFIRL